MKNKNGLNTNTPPVNLLDIKINNKQMKIRKLGAGDAVCFFSFKEYTQTHSILKHWKY